MPLLISLCNQVDTSDKSLLLMDENTHGAQWIRLPEICVNHVGCTGIERVNGLSYVLTQAAVNPHMIIYDMFFKALHTVELRQVRDPHSLCFLEGFLYLVSTGNNSIYRIKLSSSGIPEGEEELYWRFACGTDAGDFIHLNSIAAIDGQLIVTCFGLKKGDESWKSVTNGACFNLSQSKIVASGLYHPHTIKIDAEKMLVCSSGTNELICFESTGGAFGIKVRRKLEGYVRGLACSKEFYFVGQSESRQVSRSQGTANLPENIICKKAKIYLLNHDLSMSSHEINISPYGAEIYDIHYLPYPSWWLNL